MARKYERWQCIKAGCKEGVRRSGDLCWRHWLEKRDKRIEKYQKKEKT